MKSCREHVNAIERKKSRSLGPVFAGGEFNFISPENHLRPLPPTRRPRPPPLVPPPPRPPRLVTLRDLSNPSYPTTRDLIRSSVSKHPICCSDSLSVIGD